MPKNSFNCPNCDNAIEIDVELLERKDFMVCPVCGEGFKIFTAECLQE